MTATEVRGMGMDRAELTLISTERAPLEEWVTFLR